MILNVSILLYGQTLGSLLQIRIGDYHVNCCAQYKSTSLSFTFWILQHLLLVNGSLHSNQLEMKMMTLRTKAQPVQRSMFGASIIN